MNKNRKSDFSKALLSLLKIGCIGFGGGNALIPVIQDEIIDKKNIISQEEYEEDIVVASITPGALPVELAGGIGRRTAGRCGLLLGASAMALPGAILTVIFLAVLAGITDVLFEYVSVLTIGVVAYVGVLLSAYIRNTFTQINNSTLERSNKWIMILTVPVVFFVTCGKNFYRITGIDASPIFGISAVNVFVVAFFIIFFTSGKPNHTKLIISLIIGAAYVVSLGNNAVANIPYCLEVIELLMLLLAIFGFIKGVSEKKSGKKNVLIEIIKDLVMVIVGLIAAGTIAGLICEDGISFVWKGFLSSIMSFGGGDAYLTVADGMFVQSSMISEDMFYGSIVPIVNMIPGSILCKTLSAVGFVIGQGNGGTVAGLLIGVSGFICSVVASCGVFAVVGEVYTSFSDIQIFKVVKTWVRPIVSGLMLTVLSSLAYQGVRLGRDLNMGNALLCIMAIVYLVGLCLDLRKVSNGIKLAISVVLTFVLYYLINWIF